MTHRGQAYVFDSEEVVLGESRPLSELPWVLFSVFSAAAAIDISRSSSGIKEQKYSQTAEPAAFLKASPHF